MTAIYSEVTVPSSVLAQLASALGRRDEVPNQALATKVVAAADRAAVKELVENLRNKSRAIQSDCIKVLYEIGERKPELISPYCAEFAALLDSPNNRLAWGAMTALDAIAVVNGKGVFAFLANIIAAAGTGSVITRDHVVGILVKLASVPQFAKTAVPLLIRELESCPPNQFPMYVEQAAPLMKNNGVTEFVRLARKRLPGLPKGSQRRRVEKILRRLEGSSARSAPGRER